MIEEKKISPDHLQIPREHGNYTERVYLLPEEILLSIFSDTNLTLNDTRSISLTCKHWSVLIRDESIWKKIFNQTFHSNFHDSHQKYFVEYKQKYLPFVTESNRRKKNLGYSVEKISHLLFFNLNPEMNIGKTTLSSLFKDSDALKIIEIIDGEHLKGCIEECNQTYIQQVAFLIGHTFPEILANSFPFYLVDDEQVRHTLANLVYKKDQKAYSENHLKFYID